jgi:phosphoribosylaminoimidazolecarboxamide formyltransferase/IMP cyclohydrolase
MEPACARNALPDEAMTVQDNKRPTAIRVVIPFVFRHWLEQPARASVVAGGLLGATAADLFMPLFSGRLVDALTLGASDMTARHAAFTAFGGIVALNHEVDDATAAILSETFLECIIAPGFAVSALTKLRGKAQLRLITTSGWLGRQHKALQFKRVGGGFAVQERDASGYGEVQAGRVVTKRQPTASELSALEFAWSACKHVKSNAIVLAGPGHSPGIYATIGIGGGQTARVTAVQVAIEKAGDRAKSSVLASDAFFPFADGPELAVQAGVTAIIQPGGSVRDDEVVAAAEQAGVAMVFTKRRHFRH